VVWNLVRTVLSTAALAALVWACLNIDRDAEQADG
jgi:hypothetical protein